MNYFQKIFGFYVFSNIHVGIAVACLVLVSKENSTVLSLNYSAAFVFFSTVFAYSFIRLCENSTCNRKSITTFIMQQSKIFILVNSFALAGTLSFGFLIGIEHLLILLPAAFITFWYAMPLFKYRGTRISLRNYPTVKIVSIALVWAISSVLFPLQGSMQDSQVWFEFAQRFFLIMALVIPFDIRDLNNDELHIQTLPQKLGVANSKKVGIIFLVFFFMIGFIKSPLTGTSVLSTLFVFVISLLLLTKSKENRSLYYASFWVEGVPILWLFCIWGLKWFLQ